MARKRNGGGNPVGRTREGSQEYASQSKYAVEERFANSEDEFFIGRDKILLEEGPRQKRQRKLVEDERLLQPSDEELPGHGQSESEDLHSDSEDGRNESGQDDQEASIASPESDENEHETSLRNWGNSKSDYYDADIIETEADALEEEEEARRLLQKQLQGMKDDDFGFDETQWTRETQDGVDGRRFVIENLLDVKITSGTLAEEKLKILNNRYPEFAPLAKDFTDLQETHRDLQLTAGTAGAVIKQMSLKRKPHSSQVYDSKAPLAVTKFRALSAYLGAIAMYFALLTSPQKTEDDRIYAMPPNELREHTVMDNLVQCRQLWNDVKSMELPEAQKPTSDIKALVERECTDTRIESIPEVKGRSRKINAAREVGPAGKRLAEEGKRPKEKKSGKDRQNELAQLLSKAQASQSQLQGDKGVDSDSEFGDEAPLNAEEAAEKARKKKSLRFYTSQIASKSNKRGAASRDAGGDDDLPHKERLKDRQARLIREAEKRGRQAADLNEQLGNDSGDGETRPDDFDDYYDMVAVKSKQKKANKEARAEAQAEAARQDGQVFAEEKVGPDGKRAITYAIAKNKGLTPKRKKEVRNPRVKKRMKFDEKMKKLRSIRQVYKGGEGRGGYGGELTGIKMNLVKSVKL